MGCAVEVCLKFKRNTRLTCTRRPYGGAALYQLGVVLSRKYARHSLYKQFDFLQGEGDVVIAEAVPDLPGGEVVIKSITGDDGRLPLVAANNCVGIAAIETIKLLGDIDCGVALTLLKVCCTPTMLLAVIVTPWNPGNTLGPLASVMALDHSCIYAFTRCHKSAQTTCYNPIL